MVMVTELVNGKEMLSGVKSGIVTGKSPKISSQKSNFPLFFQEAAKAHLERDVRECQEDLRATIYGPRRDKG